MRERIRSELDSPDHPGFLVYIMGPYKEYQIEDLLPDDVSPGEGGGLLGEWDNEGTDYTEEDILELLQRTRDHLRGEVGVNAFLAIDVDIPLDEMDAATQTIEFARASNVVTFIAPSVGKNLGIGIETGAVLADLEDAHQERVVFVHEKGVRSAMIDSLSRRWKADVRTYEDEDDLIDRLKTFIGVIMNAEYSGDLPKLDE